MEKKTMLLHLGPKGAVQIETCFLIGDRSIAMALYQNCLFLQEKLDLLVECFLVPLTTKHIEVTSETSLSSR